jgi:hypothetical protein
MKREKMGEKKEWFLEKLGECYSISTKNGTLPREREELHSKSIKYFFAKYYGEKSVLLYLFFSFLLSPLVALHNLYLKWRKYIYQ